MKSQKAGAESGLKNHLRHLLICKMRDSDLCAAKRQSRGGWTGTWTLTLDSRRPNHILAGCCWERQKAPRTALAAQKEWVI